jgi:hypothetical protein
MDIQFHPISQLDRYPPRKLPGLARPSLRCFQLIPSEFPVPRSRSTTLLLLPSQPSASPTFPASPTSLRHSSCSPRVLWIAPTFFVFFRHSFCSFDIRDILSTFFIFFRHSFYSSIILSVLPTFFLFLRHPSYSDDISLFFQHRSLPLRFSLFRDTSLVARRFWLCGNRSPSKQFQFIPSTFPPVFRQHSLLIPVRLPLALDFGVLPG